MVHLHTYVASIGNEDEQICQEESEIFELWLWTTRWPSETDISVNRDNDIFVKMSGELNLKTVNLLAKLVVMKEDNIKVAMEGADGYHRMTLTLDRVKVTSWCTIHIGLPAYQTMWL